MKEEEILQEFDIHYKNKEFMRQCVWFRLIQVQLELLETWVYNLKKEERDM